MEDELVRFGILGCASVSQKMSTAILKTQGACLYAIGSQSLAKAQRYAEENSFPTATKLYGSYQGVLDDEAVDAVYIALPTTLHLEWALKAIERKKHVLIENPPALSTEDLDKIFSACEKQGVQFMDCTTWMHHPRTSKLKEILKNKELFGDIIEVHSTFFSPMEHLSPGFFTENIREKPELDASGALGDLGWYSAQAILWAHDHDLPVSAMALPGTKFTKEGVITSCGAVFAWEDGQLASLHCAFHVNLDAKLMLYGTNGTIEVPITDTGAFKRYGLSIFEPLDLGWTPAVEAYEVNTDVMPESLMIGRFSRLLKGIKDGTGGVDPSWPAVSRKTQQMLDAVKLSIEQGCTTVALNK